MGMVVRSNIMAVNANRQLGMNNSQVSKSLEKLSSGFRINRAGDDASGLAISEKMKAQIKGLETASANSQDGVSLVQTAEGALTEVHDMLNRMVELAGKSANGTMDTNVDRASLQKEVDALKAEIDRVSDSTNFNGIKLLDGSLDGPAVTSQTAAVTGDKAITTLDFDGLNLKPGMKITIGDKTVELVKKGKAGTNANAVEIDDDPDADVALTNTLNKIQGKLNNAKIGDATYVAAVDGNTITMTANTTTADPATARVGLTLQIGDTADEFNKVSVSVGDMSTKGLGIGALSVASLDGASAALTALKDTETGGGAINVVSSARADLGALQNRLEHTINNLDVAAENMTAANSRIRDTDMAKTMMEYTKQNVLTQAAQAMLAQANQQPQSVLQLLQ